MIHITVGQATFQFLNNEILTLRRSFGILCDVLIQVSI